MKCKVTVNTSHYPKDVPFEVPEGWCWTSIDDIAFVTKLAGFEYTEYIANNLTGHDGVPLFKGKNVQDGKIIYHFESFIPKAISDNLPRSQVRRKCLLTPYVGTIGNIGIHDKEGFYHLGSNVGKIEILNGSQTDIYEEYVKLFLQSPAGYKELTKQKKATAQDSISIEAIREVLIPIPPRGEQQRILQEISYWISFVDSIEQAGTSINDTICTAKARILELAIHGKLVPQDPLDEPGIKLLKRINPDFRPSDNLHYEGCVPKGWQECRLYDIFNVTMGQSPNGNTLNKTDGVEFHQGKIYFTEKYLSESGIRTTSPMKYATSNSLLCCVRAPVGVFNITPRTICIGRGLCALIPRSEEINLNYWFYVLCSYKDYFDAKATGTTFKAISGEIVRNTIVLMPPMLEQNRILTRITTLFVILDQISNTINGSE